MAIYLPGTAEKSKSRSTNDAARNRRRARQIRCGQKDAKRAVAIACAIACRQKLGPEMRKKSSPRTHHDRPHRRRQNRNRPPPRQAGQLAVSQSRSSKFTEVGYVGRDVESMIRDLVEIAIEMIREDVSKT